MSEYNIPDLPLLYDFETREILRQVNRANRKLAELKGVALTIPNEQILINSLTLQEAKDSSEIENIVTTQDDLYKAELNLKETVINASAKEVLSYRQAMQKGFSLVRDKKLLTLNYIKQIQEVLENNKGGFRAGPGTVLQNQRKEVVYRPPQSKVQIEQLMHNLEQYINEPDMQDIDPLIKMAIIHHQFESIHPFYDGNGRTGRIISILYLVINNLLDLPVLYLSRYITHNKGEYYRLIQSIRDAGADNQAEWEKWILFMLKGVEETAEETIRLVKGISQLMSEYKNILRPLFGRQYKHELLNNLFFHPYTKIEFIQQDMLVQRKTATKYLDMIVETGLLEKVKIKHTNYYMNVQLIELFMNRELPIENNNTEIIESISSV